MLSQIKLDLVTAGSTSPPSQVYTGGVLLVVLCQKVSSGVVFFFRSGCKDVYPFFESVVTPWCAYKSSTRSCDVECAVVCLFGW